MALILVFHNDSTGDDKIGHYNVRVLIGDGSKEHSRELVSGRCEYHVRKRGWIALVRKYLDTLEPPKPPVLD